MKPGLHADGNNLYLSVTATGAKSWRIIYTRGGKRTELGIGAFPGISIQDARERADEAQKLLQRGGDPKAVWAEAKPSHTFATVALDLINDREAGWKSAKHRQQWRNTLQTYASSIWDKPIAHVDVEDVLAILRPIWSSKQDTARRVRGRIEAVLNAARVRKLRTGENPALWRGNLELLLARQRKGPKRHHPAMPFEDVPKFMQNLCRRPAVAARALEFTILTAARTSEVLHARWSEIDLDAALWSVPAERMKAGKEHRVPLSAAAIALLKGMSRGGELVFPSSDAKKPLSNMAMEALLRRMQLKPYTVHGFRSSFRDWCGEMTEFPREIAEQALAHTIGNAVERAYRRGDALEKRRELMNCWATFVAEHLC
ncbi:MAG: tyrosine-type recombinase/integrase [Pseudomonadota bacterium]|nr:tyrosine-type recombinase/integrase [Pseudomonadota bacterium]